MKNKVVFIIPYFGKMPPYFSLWRKTAEANPEFTFLFYSDLPLPIKNEGGNIVQINITFEQFVGLIRRRIGNWITLNSPYKLCDYKPTYGYVLQEEIKDYDFWGFIDVDTVLGNLSAFVTDDLLDRYDKLWFEGHFSLFRNSSKMNELFFQRYPHVLDYKYAFSTNYSCHFDEDGTCVWAHEVDPKLGIRFYSDWKFLDTPWNRWEIGRLNSEGYVIWDNGRLFFHSFDQTHCEELMYLHLQKREMIVECSDDAVRFAVARCTFYDMTHEDSYLHRSEDEQTRKAFEERLKPHGLSLKLRWLIEKVTNGALKHRICMYVYKWKTR